MMEKSIVDNPAFADRFAQIEASDSPGWLAGRRKAAFAEYAATGLPTVKEEEWRYTDMSAVAKTAYATPEEADSKRVAALIEQHVLREAAAVMVFINGRYAAAHSRLDGVDGRVVLKSLREAIDADGDTIESAWGRCDAGESSSFSALNEALFEDGVYLHVPHEVVLETPIQALYLTVGGGAPCMVNPRNLITIGTSSQASLVESYAGDGEYFVNAVTEILSGENGVFDHYHVERESDQAVHMATIQMVQGRNSNVASKVISLDGRLIRHNIGVVLDGEGADCNLRGFYMVKGERHVDNHLNVDHAKPHCDSREFFKGVLDGSGRGVFRGRILVREDAQKTDAKQTNQSLQLSPDARVESKPQLEIFADDVKCTHGATIGQIDESALFYLQSRGLSEQAARTLLVYAFACESLDEIKIESLRQKINAVIVDRLPQGHLFNES